MMNRRTLLLPLVTLYGAILRAKRRLLEKGKLKTNTLDGAVISIGSISAGGAGKTPLVLLLADVLGRRNYAVRILTRGYGRGSSEVERVDQVGDPRRYGDEPVLLAQRSGAPVYVGANRYQAGLMAQNVLSGDTQDVSAGKTVVYLLDDGFQHRQLARDMDIVLLTRRDVHDVLLPAGNLREPLSTLKEADVIVLREEEAESLHDFISALTRESGAPPIWTIRRRLNFKLEAGLVIPERPLAFCGIARPEGFIGMLEAEGCPPAATVTFGDHHSYGDGDIRRLLKAARERGADGFLTTEKDAVKLTKLMRTRLEGIGPLVVPELHLELVDERGALEQMISAAPRLNRRRNR